MVKRGNTRHVREPRKNQRNLQKIPVKHSKTMLNSYNSWRTKAKRGQYTCEAMSTLFKRRKAQTMVSKPRQNHSKPKVNPGKTTVGPSNSMVKPWPEKIKA